MKVTMTDYTHNPVARIGYEAAICYDAKLDEESCKKRASHCKDKGHLATMRFAYATFHIEGISRVASHQLVRVAHAGILQQCVVGDTKIAVINDARFGHIKSMPISRLWELQNGANGADRMKWRVRCFDETNKCFVQTTIKEVFMNGVKPVFTICTDDLAMTCTAEHKFLTPTGFKPLSEIRPGDLVARNGVPVYRDFQWMQTAKQESIKYKQGVEYIAIKANCSYHTVRKWLKIHGLQFTKLEVASYTPAWNKGVLGEDSHSYGVKPTKETRRKLSKSRIALSSTSDKTKWRCRIANRCNTALNHEALRERDGDKCNCCSKTGGHLEIDHKVPVSQKPELAYDVDNLQLLCYDCHKEKSIMECNQARKTARFVEVRNITPAGEQKVYDLEVNHESHNYIANKFVVHNSQRYVEQTDIEFIVPDSYHGMTDKQQADWARVLSLSRKLYADCLKQGMKKEDARYILPQSCTTKLNMTGNFQMWQDLLRNRTSKTAQWEVRAVAVQIQNLLHGIAPEIFEAIL